VPVSQREKKLRGEAFENIIVDELKGIGCEIYQRFRGGESLDPTPDIYAVCDGRMKRIEAKLTQAWEKEGDRVRSGRFILSEDISPKECYAFGVDDQIEELLTVDFMRKEDPDEYIRVHRKRPKYPIARMRELRDNARCFPDVGTITRPRDDLLDEVRRLMNRESNR